MKAVWYHSLLLGVSLCQAQPGSTITFTNRFATITNLQGRVYAHIELVRADANGILYRVEGGGGMIWYTNLSPGVLEELGIPAERIEALEERTTQAALEAQALDAAEQERMRDPANWKYVHITAIERRYGDALSCSVSEMAGLVLIRYASAKVMNYFNSIVYAEQARARLYQATNDLARLSHQVDHFSSQIKEEELRWEKADAVTPTGAGIDPAYVDAAYINSAVAQRRRVNLWGVQIKQKKMELEKMRERLEALKTQQETLSSALQIAEQKLSEAQNQGATEVRVFVTSRQYYGRPILISDGQ